MKQVLGCQSVVDRRAEVIGNDDRSFRFRVQTAGTESLYSQVVHSAVTPPRREAA